MTMLCPNPPTMNHESSQKWTVRKFGPQHWDAVAPDTNREYGKNGACFDTFPEAFAHALKEAS